MRKILSLLVGSLMLFGGAAFADRGGGYRDHRGGGYRGGYTSGRVDDGRHYGGGGHGDYPRYGGYDGHAHGRGYVRQPVYVQPPAMRQRYYRYDQRPAVVVENYNQRPGYIWVAGEWQWNGGEWIWVAGHYDPDPTWNGY